MPKMLSQSLKRRHEQSKRRRKIAAVNDDQQPKALDTTLETKCENTTDVSFKSQVTIFHLHSDIWRTIFQDMSENDIIALSSVSKHFERMVRITKTDFNLRRNYNLDVNCFLNHAISTTCTSIDINYCDWLSPNTIIEMISKTNLHHLHVIQCAMNEDCVHSICNLHLKSLSFTYTKEWKFYFQKNMEEFLPFTQNLTKLEIEFPSLSCRSWLRPACTSLMLDIYTNVLQYCKELQSFKLVENYKGWHNGCEKKPSEFPSHSSPLLKLTSLELDCKHLECKMDVVNFFKLILRNKVIPLQNVDFGRYTCCLLNNGILSHPLILPDRLRFVLRSHSVGALERETYENYEDKISNWTGEMNYESIFVEKLCFKNFASFANRMISASGNSIKQVYISECWIIENFLKGIELFAINCPQITVLHLIVEGSELEDFDSYVQMGKNEMILEAISNFKNLEELAISPGILNCHYQTLEDSQMCLNVMPFWKVAQSCEQLREIRFKRSPQDFKPYSVHANTIYDIAHCKNLRVFKLYILNLIVDDNSYFRVSEITQSCTKLENLSIHILHKNFFLELSDSLSYIPDLKILRIEFRDRYLTKTFINSLLLCKKLEKVKFCLSGNKYQRTSDVQILRILLNMKKLFVFKIEYIDGHIDLCCLDQFNLLFKKIKKVRPAFSGYFM